MVTTGKTEKRQINWNQCPEVIIDAENPENLPPNIKAFKTSALNEESLRQAIALMTDPVQIVQVEIPICFKEAQAIYDLRRSTKETFWVSAGDTETFVPTDKITSKLLRRFNVEAQKSATPPETLLQNNWLQKFAAAGNASRDVFPDSAIYMAILGGVLDSQQGNQTDFHDHNEFRGYYILRSQGNPENHKGTVFLGSDDVDIKYDQEKPYRLLNKNNPTLYYGKPGCFLIFTVGDHPQMAALHDTPAKLDEKRVVCVAQIRTEALTI